jgi:molybdate transport system ATP-binding protein
MEKPIGVLISNAVAETAFRDWLYQFLGQKGFQKQDIAEFSETELNAILVEENKFGQSILNAQNQSVLTFSSGEQKKAILKHILSHKPKVVLLFGLYNHFDVAFQNGLESQLQSLSSHTFLIQIENRKKDLLPWLIAKYSWQPQGLSVLNEQKKLPSVVFNEPFPEAINPIIFQEKLLFSLNKVSVCYGSKKVLQNITWQVQKGEFWQLIGGNGSGIPRLMAKILRFLVKIKMQACP